jgi:hypothetical protein
LQSGTNSTKLSKSRRGDSLTTRIRMVNQRQGGDDGAC